MFVAIGFKAALISAALLGLLVPLRSRFLRGTSDGLPPPPGYYAGHPAIGLIRPVAAFLDVLAIPGRGEGGNAATRLSLAACLAVLAPWVAWSVIPFGAEYDLAGWRIHLVVAKLSVGVLWLLVAGVISLCAGLMIDGSNEGRVRAAVMGMSQIAGMSLALLGVLIVFGTLDPVEIVAAQDTTISALPLIAMAGLGWGWLDIPAWGVVYQPIAFVLYLVCGCLALRPAPLDSVRSARDAGASGAAIQLLHLAAHLDALVVAGVAAALFLGGGSIPYIDAELLIRSIATLFGTGLATWICMAAHLAVFLLKVALLIPLQIRLAEFLRGTRLPSSLGILWKGIIPVAFVNVLLTASALIGRRMGL